IRNEGIRNGAWVEQVEALYSGPFLHGRNYRWAEGLANYYEQTFIGILEVAAHDHALEGRRDEALRYYKEIVKRDPLREDMYHDMIRLLIGMGRKAEAVKHYRHL